MKKLFGGLVILLALGTGQARADILEASASSIIGGEEVGFTFQIVQTGATTFEAILTNTSPEGSILDGKPLIDAFGMNVNANLGTDFSVNSPDGWSFTESSGGVRFDYVGEATQAARIGVGESVTFEFEFDPAFDFPDDPLSLWSGTDSSLGRGLGGGDVSGQVAVSFQGIGEDDLSVLLGAGWETKPSPEPATLLLLGGGLGALGLAARRRRRNG